jgi:hypothetical protein
VSLRASTPQLAPDYALPHARWTSDTGIDAGNPVDLDELDLLPIGPIPSRVWYADMADFAQQISDAAARQR